MLLENKNAVIYGAGGSIGGAATRAFHARTMTATALNISCGAIVD